VSKRGSASKSSRELDKKEPEAALTPVTSETPVQFAAVEVSTGGSALPPAPDVMSISPGLAEPSIAVSARQQAHTCSAVSG